MKAKLVIISLVLLPFHAAAESDVENALSGCASLKNAVQKTKCYDAVVSLAAKSMSDKSPVPTPVPTKKLFEYSKFIDVAKANLLRGLKDESSVLWRNVFVSKIDAPVLCGELNAKNSYGAYIGFSKFYATESEGLTEIENSSNRERISDMWPRMCSAKVEEVDLGKN